MEKQRDRTTLHRALADYFSLDDLKILCADAGIDPENVPYFERGKEVYAFCISEIFRKKDILPALLDQCAKTRPQIRWDNLSATTTVPAEWMQLFTPQNLINTQGGAAFLGAINTGGGDFVGHDKIIITEEVAYNVELLDSPFLGLEAFSYQERDRYAGRQLEVDEAVNLLTEPGEQRTLLFITGASGSGKSSFAQAGVMPKLVAHYETLGMNLLSAEPVVMRPSKKPLAALAQALFQLRLPIDGAFEAAQSFMIGVPSSPVPDNAVGLLIIDQFEELFTQSVSDQRNALLAILANLPSFSQLRMHVVCTLRADYLPRLFEHKKLYDIAKRGIDLRAMTVDELKRAIQKPIQVTHPDKQFEQSLLDRLASDTAGDATLLPVLQVAVDRLWKSGSLRPKNYTSLAGLFQDHANSVLDNTRDPIQGMRVRTEVEKANILNMLCDLVLPSLDKDKTHDTRVRQTLPDLIRNHPEREAMIRELSGTNERLLSMNKQPGDTSAAPPVETVDIIHESLITKWVVLSKAVDERRAELEQRRMFLLMLDEWRRHGRTDKHLLYGTRLEEAKALVARFDVELSKPDARQLFDRSMAISSAVRQRTLRIAGGVIALLTVLLIVAGGLAIAASNANIEAQKSSDIAQAASTAAIAEKNNAEQQRTVALARSLMAQSLVKIEASPQINTLLAVEAVSRTNTLGRNDAIAADRRLTEVLAKVGGRVIYRSSAERLADAKSYLNRLAISPDGSVMAIADGSAIHLFRPPDFTHATGVLNGHSKTVNWVIYSPDGKWIASTGQDQSILLWQVNGSVIAPTPIRLKTNDRAVEALAFDATGQRLAASYSSGKPYISIWRITSPVTVSPPTDISFDLQDGWDGALQTIAFDPVKNRLAVAQAEFTYLIDLTNTDTLSSSVYFPHKGKQGINSLAFSHNGRFLVTGDANWMVHVYDMTKPDPGNTPRDYVRHRSWITSLRFSPDDKWLASTSLDYSALLWRVDDFNAPPIVLQGHEGPVTSVTFSSDSQRVYTGSQDGTVRAWVVDRPTAVQSYLPWPRVEDRVALYQTDASGLITFSQELTVTMPGALGERRHLVASKDGRWLALSDYGKSGVQLWDMHANDVAKSSISLDLNVYGITSLAISDDGKWLAAGAWQNIIGLWRLNEVPTHTIPIELSFRDAPENYRVWSVAFQRNPSGGQRLIAGGDSGNVQLWDIKDDLVSDQPALILKGLNSRIQTVAGSADGKWIAAGNWAPPFTAILWQIDATNRTTQTLQVGFGERVESVAFSPNNRWLAMASQDGTVRIVDLLKPNRAPVTLAKDLGRVWSVAFSPDNRWLAGIAEIGTRLWDLDQDGPTRNVIEWTGRASWWSAAFSSDSQYMLGAEGVFSPDGNWLAVAGSPGTVFPLNTRMRVDIACSTAGRNLTQDEWREFLRAEPYHKTCPQFDTGQ